MRITEVSKDVRIALKYSRYIKFILKFPKSQKNPFFEKYYIEGFRVRPSVCSFIWLLF